jgi:hypothetical protein
MGKALSVTAEAPMSTVMLFPLGSATRKRHQPRGVAHGG